MKNFSSRGYPALQTRTPRRTMRAMGRCNGMYHLNGLLLCEGTTLRYTEDSEDDVATAAAGGEIVLENAVTDSEKIMIGMGTKILIWPDAKSFDTATGKLEALSAAWSQTGTVTIAPCDAGGKTYTVSSVGTTEPSGPADGTLFLKQNSSSSKWAYVNVLEQYDAKSGKWAEILMLYRTCKRMIERGSIEGMSTKLDVFYAAGKLTDDEYKELTELLTEKEAQSNAKNNT